MNVRVCRQRHFLKNYDDVFNGEDLVDTVFKFLKECTSELDVERITRSNALKVSQLLFLYLIERCFKNINFYFK